MRTTTMGMVGVAAVLAGCTTGGSKGLVCDASAPGGVSVAVVGADGAPADNAVALFDEAGAAVGVLRDGESLTELPGGRYLYEVLRETGSTVGATDFGVGELCIGGADAEIAVEVGTQPAAGALWAASWETVHVFPATEGAARLEPAASLSFPLTNSFGGIAMDRTGALWAAAAPTYGARFVALPAGALTGAGEVAPALELVAPSLVGSTNFTSLSFDGDGNAWATAAPLLGGFVGVVGWSAAALREARLLGGVVEVEPTWAGTVEGITGLNGGAVDAAGDLWATSADEQAVFRVSAEELRGATGGVEGAPALPTAGRIRPVDDGGNPYRGVDGVTFGEDGLLYVLAAVSGAILSVPTSAVDGGDVEIAALQLGVTALPTGLAGDGAGGTWWSDTAEVGHVSAGGGDGVRIDAPALERAGAILHAR